jgi:hypothetical protein
MELLPANTYKLNLTGAEFKLLTAFYENADPSGRIKMSKIELNALTNISIATLTRSFRKLESLELLATSRGRKGWNFFDDNSYQLLIQSDGSAFSIIASAKDSMLTGWEETTTVGAKTPSLISEIVALVPSLISEAAASSPSLISELSTSGHVAVQPLAVKPNSKEERYLLRKYLSPELSSDKNDALVNEILKPQAATRPKQRPTPRSAARTLPRKYVNNPMDARTRRLRPEHTWNAYDVAAEFCARVNALDETLPPLLSAKTISGALNQYRKTIGTTALVELVLMERFLGRGCLTSELRGQPHKIAGAYLNLFKSDLENARRVAESQMDAIANPPKAMKYIYAPDGVRFEDNVAGRMALKYYEPRLARTVV